ATPICLSRGRVEASSMPRQGDGHRPVATDGPAGASLRPAGPAACARRRVVRVDERVVAPCDEFDRGGRACPAHRTHGAGEESQGDVDRAGRWQGELCALAERPGDRRTRAGARHDLVDATRGLERALRVPEGEAPGHGYEIPGRDADAD